MHQDAGHYAKKHPEGTGLNEATVEAVRKRVKNEKISCSAAHAAAAEAGVSPAEIGVTLDLLEIRINGCQLGLYGHKGSHEHGKAELNLPENVNELKAAIAARTDGNGISCASLWSAAAEAGCQKFQAAAACDDDDINIHSCQLGAF
jgi:hypothetical protein